MGIRYIGACCGFEPYHVRAIAEEVQKTSLSVISVLYLLQSVTLESYVTECLHSKLRIRETGIYTRTFLYFYFRCSKAHAVLYLILKRSSST